MVKVKLNDKASIFFDPTTNIIVKKGDVVELNGIQYSSK